MILGKSNLLSTMVMSILDFSYSEMLQVFSFTYSVILKCSSRMVSVREPIKYHYVENQVIITHDYEMRE